MIKLPPLVLMVAVGALAGPADRMASGQAPPDDAAGTEPTGYAVGHVLGRDTRAGLAADGMGVDLERVVQGFADALEGRDPAVTRAEMRRIRRAVHEEMEARRARRLLDESPAFRERHDANLERGRRFRELFAEQPGVVVRPSGAQYLVVEPGDGPSPGPDDRVRVTVRAQLLDRSVINEGTTPFEVEVNDTIPGGTEILQLMKVGARWQVVLPPELAFGTAGRYPDIGPGETLALTVELLEITRRGAGGSP